MIRKIFITLLAICSFVSVLFLLKSTNKTVKLDLENRFNKSSKVAMGIGTKADKFARFTAAQKMLIDPATGKVPAYMRAKELAFAKTLVNNTASKKDFDFKQRGPYNVGGRTRAFAIDVRNEDVMLAGSVSGGVWKSIDGGQNWYKVTTAEQNISITTIVQDIRQGHQNEWYFGTGELFGASQGEAGAFFTGNGVYKSNDDGENWQILETTATNNLQFSSDWQGIWRIAIDYSNTTETEIYVATYDAVQKSTDGGQTWTSILGNGGGNNVSYFTDVAIDSSGVVYATLSKENNIISNGNGTNGGIWRSANGTNFTNILPTNFPPNYNRIALAIAPSNQNILYFLVANVTPEYGKEGVTPTQEPEYNALWKYEYLQGNGGGENGIWTNLTENIYIGPNQFDDFYVQGGYDLTVAVKPDDENLVLIGGTNLFKSTNGFNTLENVSHIGGYEIAGKLPILGVYPNHHPDQHGIVFSKNDANVMYSYHDGGISKTSNILADEIVWESLNNGYISSQFYTIAIDKENLNNSVMGGLQDNGTYYTSNNDEQEEWRKPYGADGAYCFIIPNKDYVIVSTQRGRIIKVNIDEYGNPLAYQRFDPALDRNEFNFINALAINPLNYNTLYMPIGNELWIRDEIEAIKVENVFDSTSVDWKVYPETIIASNIDFTRLVATSENPFNRLYLGTNRGAVYKIDKINNLDRSEFANITSADFPNAYVSDLAVNPYNGNQVMVSFSNYGVYSIFYSEDGGENWQKVAGNLEQFANGSGNGPSIRVIDILPDNNDATIINYFAGTSTGLFHTTELNGEETVWNLLSADNISHSIVSAIESRIEDGFVAIATHGNGVFSANTPANSEITNIEMLNKNLNFNLFPNPANNVINLSFTLDKTQKISFKLYDVLGRSVDEYQETEFFKEGNHQHQIDITLLTKGIYYLEMKTENSILTKTFVKAVN